MGKATVMTAAEKFSWLAELQAARGAASIEALARISAALQILSLPRFQGQCLESCFYTDPMKTNDHNECPVYATPLQR